jgi:hypothetical protein
MADTPYLNLKPCADTITCFPPSAFQLPHSLCLIPLTKQPIQLNKLNKHNQLQLKPRRRSPFAEGCFAGGIFGDMLFQLFAPQGLKCPAAAIQRVDFGEIGKFAQQITKINFTGGHSCVFRHFNHS